MNQKLIDYIESSTGLEEEAIKLVLEKFKEYIHSQLSQKYVVTLRGLGTFSTTFSKARKGRNPRTGEDLDIPGKYRPVFKFSDFDIPLQTSNDNSGLLMKNSKEWLVKIGNENRLIPEELLLSHSVTENTPIWTDEAGWVIAGNIQKLDYLFDI